MKIIGVSNRLSKLKKLFRQCHVFEETGRKKGPLRACRLNRRLLKEELNTTSKINDCIDGNNSFGRAGRKSAAGTPLPTLCAKV